MTPYRFRKNLRTVLGTIRLFGRGQVLLTATIGLLVAVAPSASTAGTITVDASKQTAGNPHFWSAAFGTGTAALALRSDLQTHFKIGNRELGAQRVRGHGLLNDDMGIYKAAGSFDFSKLDTYLTAIVSAGMRPVMELDFMPKALGSHATWPEKSPPKDYSAWKDFIKAIAQHCVDKYGADDVGKWYWEVWNEPDYNQNPGFWTGTMSDYYTLYDNTVAALTSVLPNVLVGGPATTSNGPVSAFLAHCKSAGTRVTFVSSHNYPGGGATSTSADPSSLVSDNNARVKAITGNGYTTSAVKSFNTEWNSSYSGQGGGTGDAVKSMDNHWNVGFILKGSKLLSDQNSGETPPLDIFSYWVLSDVFDESSGPSGSYILGKNSGNLPFGAVFGTMTAQGLRKAAFNAFKLLNYLGPKRLSSGGGSDNSGGINAMATTSDSGDSLQILLYNYNNTLSTASGAGDSQAISVSNLPTALASKEVFVTQYVVDETHSNPYYVWEKTLSKPGSPSESEWQQMRAAQHLSVTTTKKTLTDATFSTTITMAKQSGTLIIISVKRPLMGRDALVEIEGEDYDGQSGATKEDSGDSTSLGQAISFGSSGGNVFFRNVDFTDDGVSSLQLRVKSSADTTLELHQATASGALLGKCTVTSTSGAWATQSCTLSQAATGFSATDPLYLVVAGALHLNWIKFQAGSNPTPTGGAGGGGSSAGVAAGSGNGGSAGEGAGGATAKGGAAGNGAGGAGGAGKGGAAGSGAGGIAGSGAGGAAKGGAAGNGAGGNGSGGDNPGSNGGDSGNTDPGSKGGSAGSGNGGSANASGGAGGGSTGPGTSASGCSCHVGSASGPSGAMLMFGIVALGLGLRRQRARRSR